MAKDKQHEQEAATDAKAGGSGGPCVRARGRADTRLIEKALKQRWPIREEYREALVERMVAIVQDEQSSPREATSAFRALVAAEGQNQADAPPVQQHEHKHDLQVRTEDDWYGHHHAPNADGAPDADPAAPGAIQDDGVRPAMGQNGNGHAGPH